MTMAKQCVLAIGMKTSHFLGQFPLPFISNRVISAHCEFWLWTEEAVSGHSSLVLLVAKTKSSFDAVH
jgi:hypothetical protein